MRSKLGCFLLAAFASGFGFTTQAQEPAKIPKIGWLLGRPIATSAALDGARRELRALGYVEGKNIAFEYRSADNQLDRLPTLAEELVRLKVDVILAAALNEALAAKAVTQTIPIVFLGNGDPVAAGLIDSLARPGGNITGFTTIAAVLVGKLLELLKETVPKLSTVAVLWNPQEASSAQQWKESQLPARELGLQLHSMEVSAAGKFESAFKAATDAHSGAVAVTQFALGFSNQKQITELAVKTHLPAIYTRRDPVDAGGLMSYGSDRIEPFKRVAVFVDKILKGTKPADIPVEQPRKFEFVINLKAAKQIGLTIPPNLLVRASTVIK